MMRKLKLTHCLLAILFICFQSSSWAQDTVQFALPGDFVAPFENLNLAVDQSLDVDGNGTIDIVPPCSCQDLPTISNGQSPNGIFDNQLIIATGLSGQNWVVGTTVNLLNPNNLSPMIPGTAFNEIGNTGVYVLPFAHRDNEIFFATVEDQVGYPGQSFGPVFSECYYPHPSIENIPTFLCSDEPDIILFGEAKSGFDDFVFPITPEDEFWIIQRQEDLEVFVTQIFSPSQFGEGTYDIRYTFNAGNNAFSNPNFTGCSVTVEETVYVREAAQMACFTELNVSIGANCEGTIIPSQLLATPQVSYEAFTIEIFDEEGNSIGDSIQAAFHGQQLTARITDDCSGNFCTTLLNVFDISDPILTIPPDTTVVCTGDTDVTSTGSAFASDCSDFTLNHIDNVILDECGNPSEIIERTWIAIDIAGNVSSETQIINVARGTQSQLRFPNDIEIACEDILANPNLADPTLDGAGMPNLVTEPRCGMIYTSSDDTISICGPTEMLILREWTVLDACGAIIYQTDGLGNDNMQLIRIRDDNAPVINADNFEVATEMTPPIPGEDCVSRGFIPAPTSVFDACSNYTVRIFTPVGEADYLNGQNGLGGALIPDPGLILGDHNIIYEAIDDCGNRDSVTVTATVIDLTPPLMLCNNLLTVSLSQTGDGRIFPDDIDEGSGDDCCSTNNFQIKLIEEPDSLYRDFLEFFCTNDTVISILRLEDCAGNFNTCATQLIVEDTQPVQIVSSPADTSISCLFDYSAYLDSSFQAPVFSDNCDFDVQWFVSEQVNSCGIGQIVRQWVAQDIPNNAPAVVSQVITLTEAHDYDIDIPADRNIDCSNPDFFVVSTSSNACDSLDVSVVENTIAPHIPGACYSIQRIYDIINYCEWDGISPPTILPRKEDSDPDTLSGDPYSIRSDGDLFYEVFDTVLVTLGPSTGYYQYEQIIAVFDSIGPIINNQPAQNICQDSTCRGTVSFPIELMDNCSGIASVSYLLVPEGSVAQIDTLGIIQRIDVDLYQIDGSYPVGNYSFLIQALDDCGNQSQASFAFTIEDCFAPTISCRQDSVIILDGNTEFFLRPSDFLLGTEDLCGDTSDPIFSFSSDLSDSTRWYNCDSLGQRELVLFATDEAGNQGTCALQFTLTDPAMLCVPRVNLDGFVLREDGEPINRVGFTLTGPGLETLTTYSDETGYYHFSNVISDGDYTLRPFKDTFPRNGVTTFDLIRMQRHVLDVVLLDSPYKVLSADVNNSGAVSTFDVILTRKLILDIDTAFASQPSWTFVAADYDFPTPTDPWVEIIPDELGIRTMQDSSINWIGMKMGDVNNSNNPQTIWSPTVSPNSFLPITIKQEANGQIRIKPDQIDLAGIQFSLAWNNQHWRFKKAGFDNQQDFYAFSNLEHVEQGWLNFSWDRLSGREWSDLVLEFEPLDHRAKIEDFYLLDNPIQAEAYWLEGGYYNFAEPKLYYQRSQLDQISRPYFAPNPFKNQSQLVFQNPEQLPVRLSIYDTWGRIIHEQNLGHLGRQAVWDLDQNILPKAGLYFYNLSIGRDRYQGKLIKQ